MQFPIKAWRAEACALGSMAPMVAQLTISFIESRGVARLGITDLAAAKVALSLYLLVFLFALGLVAIVAPLAAQAHGRSVTHAVD